MAIKQPTDPNKQKCNLVFCGLKILFKIFTDKFTHGLYNSSFKLKGKGAVLK